MTSKPSLRASSVNESPMILKNGFFSVRAENPIVPRRAAGVGAAEAVAGLLASPGGGLQPATSTRITIPHTLDRTRIAGLLFKW